MSPKLQKVVREALTLPEDDRAALVEALGAQGHCSFSSSGSGRAQPVNPDACHRSPRRQQRRERRMTRSPVSASA